MMVLNTRNALFFILFCLFWMAYCIYLSGACVAKTPSFIKRQIECSFSSFLFSFMTLAYMIFSLNGSDCDGNLAYNNLQTGTEQVKVLIDENPPL